MFGGSAFYGTLDDVWAFALGGSPGWTRITPPVTGPPRKYACGVLDSLNSRLFVLCGNDGAHDQNDVWSLSLSGTPAWTRWT